MKIGVIHLLLKDCIHILCQVLMIIIDKLFQHLIKINYILQEKHIILYTIQQFMELMKLELMQLNKLLN